MRGYDRGRFGEGATALYMIQHGYTPIAMGNITAARAERRDGIDSIWAKGGEYMVVETKPERGSPSETKAKITDDAPDFIVQGDEAYNRGIRHDAKSTKSREENRLFISCRGDRALLNDINAREFRSWLANVSADGSVKILDLGHSRIAYSRMPDRTLVEAPQPNPSRVFWTF